MSALRLGQAGKEILYIRVFHRRARRSCACSQLHRHTAFLRYVRHGPASQTLTVSAADFVHGYASQIFHRPIGLVLF